MSTQRVTITTYAATLAGAVSRVTLVSQAVTGPAGTDGAGVSVAVKEAGTEKVAVATGIDFLAGFDVAGAAGVASVSLDLTEYTGGALPLAGGGTGATTAADARTALGLGTAATASSSAFDAAGAASTVAAAAAAALAAHEADTTNVHGIADTAALLTSASAASTYVAKSLYDANTVLAATADNTPAALTVAASTIVGRKATGDIAALTAAEAGAVIGAEVFKQAQAINAQTGTTYTLVAGDAGKLVTLSNASAITLTLPQDSDATIAVGSFVDLLQLGAGQVTVAAGTGATLRTSGLTAKARAQYSRLGVQKVSANTWSLYGDLAAS